MVNFFLCIVTYLWSLLNDWCSWFYSTQLLWWLMISVKLFHWSHGCNSTVMIANGNKGSIYSALRHWSYIFMEYRKTFCALRFSVWCFESVDELHTQVFLIVLVYVCSRPKTLDLVARVSRQRGKQLWLKIFVIAVAVLFIARPSF